VKRSLVAVVLLSTVALAAPHLAAADTAVAPAKLSQTVVTANDPALAKIKMHAKFASVDSVCFDFVFVGDLLDPGEILRVTPLQLLPSLSGPGFRNVGAEPLTERELCLDSSINPDITALFADGKDKDLEIGIETGSVRIATLLVSVTGTRA
jgi:hypothetical protein